MGSPDDPPDQSTNSGVECENRGAPPLAGHDLRVDHRSLEALIPYARNARTHSDAQVAQIAGCCCPRTTGHGHGIARALMNSRGER